MRVPAVRTAMHTVGSSLRARRGSGDSSRQAGALHHMSRRLICRLILSIMIGGIGSPVQAYAASGRILGSVTDQKGAAIGGGTVELKNLETGSTQSAVTDSRGQYSFSSMPEGRYSVSASYPGFETPFVQTWLSERIRIPSWTSSLVLARLNTAVVVTAPILADVVSEPELSKKTSYVTDSAQLLQDMPGVSVVQRGRCFESAGCTRVGR